MNLLYGLESRPWTAVGPAARSTQVGNSVTVAVTPREKETGSAKWTAVSAILPLVMGFAVCFVVAQVWRIVG